MEEGAQGNWDDLMCFYFRECINNDFSNSKWEFEKNKFEMMGEYRLLWYKLETGKVFFP